MKKQMHKCTYSREWFNIPIYSFISAGCELPTQTVFFLNYLNIILLHVQQPNYIITAIKYVTNSLILKIRF